MRKLYISTLILAMAVSACQEETLQPLSPVDDNEMQLTFLAPGTQTKATESLFEASDKIGVYVTDWVDAETPMPLQISGNRVNNAAFTYNGGTWKSEKKIYWGNGKSDIYAYYPYFDEVSDVNSQPFSVALDQNEEADGLALNSYEASDFLWVKAKGAAKKDGDVKLAMKHIMSKLTVKIVAGEDYVGSLPDDASVLIHSTVAAARIDLETGAVVKDPYSGAQSINMRKIGNRVDAGVESVVYSAVVVPQMLETPVPFLEINSKSVSYLLEDSFNFRPGVAYTYTVTLNTSTTAIKVEIGCELEDWNSTGGDDVESDGSGDEGTEDEDDGVDYKNLSVEGTANCYMISEAGDYKFKAVQGNMDATVGNVKSVEVLWESFGTDTAPQEGDLIAKTSYKNGYIRFSTPKAFTEGNAVIAAKNSAGVILWSWHIWLTDEPVVQLYNERAGMMMDRNLGATSAEPGDVRSLGLLYQWGRKDPFVGSSSINEGVVAASTHAWDVQSTSKVSSCVDFCEKNPTTLCKDMSLSNDSWSDKKSAADPCPVGWSVPRGGRDGFWNISGLLRTPFDYGNMGMSFNIVYPDRTWYPAAGYLDYDGKFKEVGTRGYYYTSYVDGYNIMWLSDYEFTTNAQESYGARSVRCYREYDEALIPEKVLPDFPVSGAVTLSDEGTANCYVVSSAGTYEFPAVKGNGSEKLAQAVSASVIWESFATDKKISKGELISAVKCKDGKVYFKTADAFKEGNALIAVQNTSGEILWSWHIWMTDKPQEQEYYNGAGTMLDRNLGALTAVPGEEGVLGLTYQWGRKDPFMGKLITNARVFAESTYLWPSGVSPYSENGTIEYAISHPTVVFEWGNNGDWLYTPSNKLDNTRWQSEKTIYDPCPAGWRVPDGGQDGVWCIASGRTSEIYANDRLNFSGIFGEDSMICYPVVGCESDEYQSTYYWSCTPHDRPDENFGMNVLQVESYGWTYPMSYQNRCDRHYVRCQKDETK